jgi:hypothetical protein
MDLVSSFILTGKIGDFRRSSGKISVRRAKKEAGRIHFQSGGVFYTFVSATKEIQDP